MPESCEEQVSTFVRLKESEHLRYRMSSPNIQIATAYDKHIRDRCGMRGSLSLLALVL